MRAEEGLVVSYGKSYPSGLHDGTALCFQPGKNSGAVGKMRKS